MSKQYYVYIMTNKTNTTLYNGMTDNLLKRVWQHKNKVANGFTSKYNINKLVYYEVAEHPMIAIAREKTIKNLVRRKKNQLVEGMNPNWKDLYSVILEGTMHKFMPSSMAKMK